MLDSKTRWMTTETHDTNLALMIERIWRSADSGIISQ